MVVKKISDLYKFEPDKRSTRTWLRSSTRDTRLNRHLTWRRIRRNRTRWNSTSWTRCWRSRCRQCCRNGYRWTSDRSWSCRYDWGTCRGCRGGGCWTRGWAGGWFAAAEWHTRTATSYESGPTDARRALNHVPLGVRRTAPITGFLAIRCYRQEYLVLATKS